MAEWSKALVLGTSHFGGVGSNPTPVKTFFFGVLARMDFHTLGQDTTSQLGTKQPSL